MTMKKNEAAAQAPALNKQKGIADSALLALHPCANAAAIVKDYSDFIGDQDVVALSTEINDQCKQVAQGNQQIFESMLTGQAHALQSIFVNMARRANNQSQMSHIDAFMRLALKAQNQSRATLETLAAIKNPPLVIARQANINHGSGNQQVNNGTPAPIQPVHIQSPSRAGKKRIPPNELLEVKHGSEKLDPRAAGKAGRTNPAMATLE